MASTETGWTKEKPTVEGVYWSRIDEFDKQPTPVKFERYPNGVAVFEFGCAESFQREHETEDYEYLGPVSPSDAEQLVELRRVGTEALRVLEHYKERHLVPPYFSGALADLRDALAGVDRTVTVQCADCLTWFDKKANHTCRQQVRRNQRSATK